MQNMNRKNPYTPPEVPMLFSILLTILNDNLGGFGGFFHRLMMNVKPKSKSTEDIKTFDC
jgi:hypothetical protein